jgi:hypothetical protein
VLQGDRGEAATVRRAGDYVAGLLEDGAQSLQHIQFVVDQQDAMWRRGDVPVARLPLGSSGVGRPTTVGLASSWTERTRRCRSRHEDVASGSLMSRAPVLAFGKRMGSRRAVSASRVSPQSLEFSTAQTSGETVESSWDLPRASSGAQALCKRRGIGSWRKEPRIGGSAWREAASRRSAGLRWR